MLTMSTRFVSCFMSCLFCFMSCMSQLLLDLRGHARGRVVNLQVLKVNWLKTQRRWFS